MPSEEEILFDRVSHMARTTGKIYAVMTRGAWAERIIRPIQNENNTHQFTGRIFNPFTGTQGEEFVIGFYHPVFCGYVSNGTIIEVVDSHVEEVEVRYIARGRGRLSFSASPACVGPMVMEAPCEGFQCISETYVWGSNPNTTPLGTVNSTAIYDYDTMDHDMGPNEIPAYLSLPGYDGEVVRPSITRQLLLMWSPNLSAFQPAFQMCGQLPCAGPPRHEMPVGPGVTTGVNCCANIVAWEAEFGEDWCEIIKQMIEDGEITISGFGECDWLLQQILDLC